MKTKNSLEAEIKGKVITISITATCEETANKLFDGIEHLCLNILKADLEAEWQEKQ